MAKPDGTLTPAQHEILEAIWQRGREGASVAEIWQEISQVRDVARTTILNQVDRLEKRGWLKRKDTPKGVRYFAAISRRKASQALATEFVDDFFGGSASELVMNLLGSKRLNAKDVAELRKLLNDQHGSTDEETGR